MSYFPPFFFFFGFSFSDFSDFSLSDLLALEEVSASEDDKGVATSTEYFTSLPWVQLYVLSQVNT